MWLFYALLAALTAALMAVFGKLGLKGVDATLATTLRGIIMAGLLVAVTAASGKWRGFSPSQLAGRDWLFLVLASVAGAASWLFYFLALKTGDASRVAAVDRTSIVGVVLLAALFLGEALTLRSAAGAAMVAAGAYLIAVR